MFTLGLLALNSGKAYAAPSSDPKSDGEIEAGLPEIEGARLVGRLLGIHARYQDRSDRAGKVLSAWSIPDDQESWNALHALSSFDHPEVWADLGTAAVYLRWKTYDQARQALDRARAKGQWAELSVLDGDLARSTGNAGAAETAYRAALALRPSDPLAFDGLGLLALAAQKPAEAEALFVQARNGASDDPVAARGLVDARLGKGDLVAALAAYDDLHRLLPGNADDWLQSAKLRIKQGDQAGAARDFEAARKLGSNDPELLSLLSDAYRTQGRTDEERRLLDDLIAQGVAGPAQYARRAELREATDAPGALADLAKGEALAAKATNKEGQAQAVAIAIRRAALTAKVGALSDAIGLYRQLAQQQPDQKPALLDLETRAGLLRKPLHGTVNEINGALLAEVNRLFHQQLKQNPTLGGTLKVRVVVLASGSADSVDFLEDSVKSPELTANLRWNAQDAKYPPQANRYVFKYVLHP